MMDDHIHQVAASMIMSVMYNMPPIILELYSGVKAINDFAVHLPRAALSAHPATPTHPQLWVQQIVGNHGVCVR
jgi:hypothetical protein